MSCSSPGQTPHRGSITERAHCPQARTELPFFKKRQRGIPYVGCCSDEKPFHPAVFQSPLAALITGPGAALWAHCAHAGSWEKAARLILTTQIKTTHKYAQHVRERTLAEEPVSQLLGDIPVCLQQLQPADTSSKSHRGRRELVWRHFQSRNQQEPRGCGAVFLPPDPGETFVVERRAEKRGDHRSQQTMGDFL